MWAARNKKHNTISLFTDKPIRGVSKILGIKTSKNLNIWEVDKGEFIGYLPKDSNPTIESLKWYDEPMEVALHVSSTYTKTVNSFQDKELELLNTINELKAKINSLKTVNFRLSKNKKHLEQKISKLCNPNNKKYVGNKE